MRSLQLSAFLALLAACAVNASVPENELDFDLILSRQAGTPKYECHQNCGKTSLPSP
jgi:outer membrane biogenesis lipoprotein LolB